MATLLWLVIGVLLGLLAWIVRPLVVWLIIAPAVAVVAVLLPRPLTAVGAKVAIGTGLTYLVVFGPRVLSDPLQTSAATYLWVGFGAAATLIGVAAAWRNHRRQARLRAAGVDQP